MSDKLTRDRVERVLVDLIINQQQLVAHHARGVPVDLDLAERSLRDARTLLGEIRLGSVQVDRWREPAKEEHEETT